MWKAFNASRNVIIIFILNNKRGFARKELSILCGEGSFKSVSENVLTFVSIFFSYTVKVFLYSTIHLQLPIIYSTLVFLILYCNNYHAYYFRF